MFIAKCNTITTIQELDGKNHLDTKITRSDNITISGETIKDLIQNLCSRFNFDPKDILITDFDVFKFNVFRYENIVGDYVSKKTINENKSNIESDEIYYKVEYYFQVFSSVDISNFSTDDIKNLGLDS